MQNSVDMGVNLAGLRFNNPIAIAAVGTPWGRGVAQSPRTNAEYLLKNIKAGASCIYIGNCGFVSKETIEKLNETARPETIPSSFIMARRFLKAQSKAAPYSVEGLYNIVSPFWSTPESINRRGKANEEVMLILKENKPDDVRIIANVVGLGDSADTYIDAAKRWEQLGADMLLLNFTCIFPATMGGAVEDFFTRKFPARFQGVLIGDNPDIVERITREVVKQVKIPVGVKLSAETGFPRVVGIAKAVKLAGAKWIESLNGGVGIAPPDIYNRGRPLWPFADGNPFCQTSGSWLRPSCYKHVAAIAKFVPGIDITASGGLVTPEHCIEAMMLGAKLAQPCTGVIEQGRGLIRKTISFIQQFMIDQGYKSVDDFIGLGKQYLKNSEEINFHGGELVAVLDENKCSRCGICLNGMCTALHSDHGIVRVDADKCEGCGGCILACKFDALHLTLRS